MEDNSVEDNSMKDKSVKGSGEKRERYMDTALLPKERAKILLEEMSLEEKVAQLNCVCIFSEEGTDPEKIKGLIECGIGAVSTLELRRMKTLEEAADWQIRVQKAAMESSPHRIPALFHMEGLCGAFLQGAASFPAGIGRGASWDPELEEEIGRVVGRQEKACGITHIFAPVLDISRDSRMGRQGETYGEDPTLAAALGVAYTRGIQTEETAGRKAQAVAKHFLAFHNSLGGIHGADSQTPERLLQEIYGKPFQAAISLADLKGIMPCYCSLNGEPVSLSKHLLTDLLREDMGFDGLCVSDYGAIGNTFRYHHVGENLEETGQMALSAGMDMELPNPDGFGEAFIEMFRRGEADEAALDAAVLRVLTEKFAMGLFEHPFALSGEKLDGAFYGEGDREVSLQSAKESLVLLKNDGTLPLREDVKKIALIGPHADSPRKYFGGYTHMCMMESTYAIANSIAGVSGNENVTGKEIATVPGTHIQSDEGPEFDAILKRQKPQCKSVLEQLRVRYPNAQIRYAWGYPVAGNSREGFAEALEIARDADVILLTLGGKHGTCSMATMGEGVDASNINLPPCQDAFLEEVSRLGKPMVGIHFDGRPISSDAADHFLNALLEAWSPAEMGAEAIVGALAGDDNPGGKLPVTVAYHAGQIPIYYNHPGNSCWHQAESIGFADYVDLPHTPRYVFGHGLSYTQFAYDDLQISPGEAAPFDKVTISCQITNTGTRAGDEVVQLYLKDVQATMVRPVKELAGFARVSLAPEETKRVCFTVEMSQLAFLDRNMEWKIEKGRIEAEIGSSSGDIRLRGSFDISENAWVDGKNRGFFAKTQIVTKNTI